MKKLLGVYLLLLPVPLYFYLNGHIYNEDNILALQASAKVLPISFFLTLIGGALFLLKVLALKRYKVSEIDKMQFVSIFIMVATYTLSLVFYGDTINPSLLLLYLIPQLFAYFIGKMAVEYYDLDAILKFLWYSIAIFCSIQIVSSFYHYGVLPYINGRGIGSILGFMSIYGIYIFYPALLSVLLFIGFKIKLENKILKYVGSFFIFTAIIISGAREPLLMIVMMFLAYKLCSKTKFITLTWRMVVSTFLIIGVVFFLLQFFPEIIQRVPLLAKVFGMGSSKFSVQQVVTGGRYEIWVKFAHYIVESPHLLLIGSGFSLSPLFFKGTFHNQWIDFISQGGIFYMLSIFFIFFLAIQKSYELSKYDRSQIIIVAVLISFALVSFFINTNLRVPYTSILVWFLIGYVSEKKAPIIDECGAVGDVKEIQTL